MTAQVVVMGVSGSGKSTVGRALARALGDTPFLEGDQLHPAANIELMRAGTPLDDTARQPWLALLAEALAEHRRDDRPLVLACSALRRAYRDVLRGDSDPRATFFVHLDVPATTAKARIERRSGHFMPSSLLASQVGTLEPLAADEHGVTLPADAPLVQVVSAARTALGA